MEQFGDKQARVYAESLSDALQSLIAGPTTIGVRERTDIAKGLFTLHVARPDGRGGTLCCFVSMPINKAAGSKSYVYFTTRWTCEAMSQARLVERLRGPEATRRRRARYQVRLAVRING
ncbi:MAG: hypothetical protein WDO56_34900 [Gammaproteobacteria bacterium]